MNLNELIGDPWRCVCPECYSWHIVQVDDLSKPRTDQRKIGETHEQQFQCDECKKTLQSVYDRKNGRLRTIDELLSTHEVEV